MADNIVEEFTVADHSVIDPNVFTYGTPLPAPFNDGTFFNYGSATLSTDNREMILCACKKRTFMDKSTSIATCIPPRTKGQEREETTTNGLRW